MAITFTTTLNPTPFGFWNSDPVFQSDAEKVVTFVLRKHGEDILSVELTKKMIWACFEEATLQLNASIIEYQAKSNLSTLLGTPTGSVNPDTGQMSINLTDVYVRPNLEYLIRQAEPYAAEVGYGQSQDSFSGSITLQQGKQDYDLYTDLVDHNGTPVSSLMPSGSSGRLKIYEVYHFAPVQFVYNSNLAASFATSGMPLESWVPDTRFQLLPLFEDVLRASMLDAATKVRRSHYSYRISGRYIRILPIPNNVITSYNDKLWIRFGYPSSVAPGISDPSISGSISVSGSSGFPIILPDGTLYGAAHPANLPMGLISYHSLNPWARNWIYQYTMAAATELLGRVRSKMKRIPIPGAELELNGDDLVSQGREDKTALLLGEGGLLQKLDALTYDKLATLELAKAEAEQKQLSLLPMPPKYLLFIA
jgi:hypothetical protein